MANDAILEMAKLILLPAIGFLAGFAAQWFLQERKSRDEMVRALAEQRAVALCKLWEITTLPVEISSLPATESPSAQVREQLDRSILGWYTKEAGALFLSWQSTQILFQFLDLVRSSASRRAELESVVSSLRSRLKLDCGVYSRWEAGRTLLRPRAAPWNEAPSNLASGP